MIPTFKKIVTDYPTMLHRVDLPAVFASASPESEARDTIEKDIPRCPRVDFHGRTIDSHRATWTHETVSYAYTQGNDTAGIFGLSIQYKFMEPDKYPKFAKKYLRSDDAQLFPMQNFSIFNFAYYDDQEIPCGFSLAYSKKDPSLWAATIISNTPVDPKHRTVSFFCPDDIIQDLGDTQLTEHNVLPEILKSLNSQSITLLLNNILNQDGTVNIDVLKQLELRVQGGANIDDRDNKKVLLDNLIAKARRDEEHNDAVEIELTRIERSAQDDINFYTDDNFAKILQLPDILKQINIAKYECYEQSLASFNSNMSNVFEHILFTKSLAFMENLKQAESSLVLTTEYLLARNQLLEIATAILKNPKNHEIPEKIKQIEALFSEELTKHIPTLKDVLSDFSLAATDLHKLLLIRPSDSTQNTHFVATLTQATKDYASLQHPKDYDTRKLWESLQLSRFTDSLESLHSNLILFKTTSDSYFEDKGAIHGDKIYKTIELIIKNTQRTPLDEKDSLYLDQIMVLVNQNLEWPQFTNAIDDLAKFTQDRVVYNSSLLKQLKAPLSDFCQNAILKASRMNTLKLASMDYQKEYVNRFFTNIQRQASTNQKFSEVQKHMSFLQSKVLKLKDLEEQMTEFEQNILNLSTKPEIKLQQKGSQLLRHIKIIAGTNPSTLTTKDLSILNDVLSTATKALKNPQDAQTIRKLGELSQQVSGKSSRFWKGLGLALLAFAGAALVVAGVLGAIPTGGVSLMLVAAGAAALTVAGGASIVKGREHGFAKSISMFKTHLPKDQPASKDEVQNDDDQQAKDFRF